MISPLVESNSDPDQEPGKRSYSVVDRVIDILECFFDESEPSLTQLSQQTGFDPATVSRYVSRLVDRGWAERDPLTKRFRLGPQVIALGNAATGSRPMRQVARAHMARLVGVYDETINLAMRMGDELLIIDAIESQRSIKRGAQIGQRDTWHNSSLGKATLAAMPAEEADTILRGHKLVATTPRTITDRKALQAELAATRQRGYALDLEEGELGLRCVGVALIDSDDVPTFAMSISGPAGRLNDALLAQIGSDLVAVAGEISHGRVRDR